jgi:hypothetical protein
MRSAAEGRVGAIGFCTGLAVGLFLLSASLTPTMGQDSQRREGTGAQRPNAETAKLATWRKSMASVPLPKKGCFKASYPNDEWQEVPCVKAPAIPFQVGDGDSNDFSAKGGSISSATGSFMSVTGVAGFADETDTASTPTRFRRQAAAARRTRQSAAALSSSYSLTTCRLVKAATAYSAETPAYTFSTG